ncbi:MAG: beta-glucosidase [Verrucomicrobia bacterium]|nr:MAG: beta-glucosidase [Verrucomicrobiota bacterium]
MNLPPVYQNPEAPIVERVEDLLSRMTLEEKVAQVCALSLRDSTAAEEGLAGIVNAVRAGLANGIGQIENTFDPRKPRESVRVVNDLQRRLRMETRLGIPALIGSECAHGHAGYNSTVLPVPLAMASSWNPSLVQEAFDCVGREARARGAHEAHTPVLDLGRDPRWGRLEETFGEDTCLVSAMGVAAVTGLQGGASGNPGFTHVIASPKHFAGYGQVAGGRNFAETTVDRFRLFDEILPPFEAAVREAGAQGMMASHCDVDGVPAHANRWLLTDLLRERWGFEGYVVSDYNDVPRLEFFQHVAESPGDAAALALSAGVDMDLPVGQAYSQLVEVIRDRPELERCLDASVRRVLRLKFMLGLFEDPLVEEEKAEQIVGCEAHVAVARRLAEESVVLLKNANAVLPFRPGSVSRIAVIGPNAASWEVGNYTVGNDATCSILDGLREVSPEGVELQYELGCRIPKVGWDGRQTVLESISLAEEEASIQRAVDLAAGSDVAVLCLGGNTGTSREAFFVEGIKGDRARLDLLGNQRELFRRLKATGVPVVVLYMGGRCYSEPEIAANADAILNTFYLGQEGGRAVARILFGLVDPSGRLPVTVPRSVGQLPVYYSQKAISFYKDYLDEEPGPLYPFGYGLSYTEFAYGEVELSKGRYHRNEVVHVSIRIRNVGPRAGAEVVQVYFRDLVASIIRPARQLIAFEKIYLDAGEERVVRFSINPATDLAFTGQDGVRDVEPGEFEILVGRSSRDIRSTSRFFIE